MSMVKRFRIRCKNGTVTIDPHGVWIAATDYDTLAARLAEAERLLKLTFGHLPRISLDSRPPLSVAVDEFLHPKPSHSASDEYRPLCAHGRYIAECPPCRDKRATTTVSAASAPAPIWNSLFKRWEVPDPKNAALRPAVSAEGGAK